MYFCGLFFRRPEITIVSAEPLASNSWFSGASVGFPPPPPQSGWSAGIQAVSQVGLVRLTVFDFTWLSFHQWAILGSSDGPLSRLGVLWLWFCTVQEYFFLIKKIQYTKNKLSTNYKCKQNLSGTARICPSQKMLNGHEMFYYYYNLNIKSKNTGFFCPFIC